MNLLRERIDDLRSLSGQGASLNWVQHYLATNGRLPDGWEMVFGTPRYTGGKRVGKRKLDKTTVLPALKTEATISLDVNPPVRDVLPIPVPEQGGTRKPRFRTFRANVVSGDRTQTHETSHRKCDTYDPACRDMEWESPTWIGGADWATRPLFRYRTPDAKETFAQDPLGLIPADTSLPASIPVQQDVQARDSTARVRQVDLDAATFSDALGESVAKFRYFDEATTAPSMSQPFGLVSKIASSGVDKLKKAWLSLSKSGSSAPSQPDLVVKRNRRRDREAETGEKVFTTKHKPGTPQHDAALFKQAIELRRMTGKPMHIVDYNGRRYVSANPQRHGKIVHTVEAITTASFPTKTAQGTTFFGQRALRTIEKERRARSHRQASSKCVGYDPKCRDKEWEIPAPIGGVNFSMVRR